MAWNAMHNTVQAARCFQPTGYVLYRTKLAHCSARPSRPRALASGHGSVACGYDSVQRAANTGAARLAEVLILQASTVLSAYQSAAPGCALVRVLTVFQRAARIPVAWSALAGALHRAACRSSCSTAAHLASSWDSDAASGLWTRVPPDTRGLATRSALARALHRAACRSSCSTAAHLASSWDSDESSGLWTRVPPDTRGLATRSALARALNRAAASNSSIRAIPPAPFRER